MPDSKELMEIKRDLSALGDRISEYEKSIDSPKLAQSDETPPGKDEKKRLMMETLRRNFTKS